MSKTYSITYNAYEYGHAGAASYQTARLVCTFTVPDSTDISSASASTPAITYSISLQLKKMVDGNYTYANTGTHDWRFYTGVKIYGGNNSLLATKNISTSYSSKAATLGTSWTTVKTATGTLTASSFNTSTIFNSGNPSSATSTLYLSVTDCSVEVDDGTTTHYTTTEGAKVQNGAVFTLKEKPTFSATPLSKNTAGYYPDLTTVSTTISDSSAKYGGSIASSLLTIGNQTASGSGDGTLSITLNASGSFTPTITVTDSRGIASTQTLTPINVSYAAPSANIVVERINDSTFLPDDEGTNALLTAGFSYMDDVTTLKEPTVTVTDSNGSAVAVTVTWYANYSRLTGFSNAVTWPVSTANPTLYAKVVGTFNYNSTYTVSLTPKDGNDVLGTTISQTLGQAFYTVDFLAGGHGVSFGQPALQPGFQCAMDVSIDADLTVNGDTELLTGKTEVEKPYYSLDTTAATGTTDGDLYAAITALGWQSDVIE